MPETPAVRVALSEAIIRARPKSTILTSPLASRITLEGFMSRWHDLVSMRLRQAARHLDRDIDRLARRQRTAPNALGQSLAFVIGHDNEELPVGALFNAVDGADVRVVQPRSGASFPQETVLIRPASSSSCEMNFSATLRSNLVSCSYKPFIPPAQGGYNPVASDHLTG